MPGIIIAAILMMGAATGAAKKEGLFKKGADTTYIDTVRFERQAAEMAELRGHSEAIRLRATEKAYENDHPENRHVAPDLKEEKPSHGTVM